jgi:hypothetical protein
MSQDYSISRPLEGAVLTVLSLGGGVQSCALALMSARGDLPMLDAAIFADTGDEKRGTYRYLDWLETQLPFPLIRVRRPGATLGQHAMACVSRPMESSTGRPPYYLADPKGMAPKQCNADFKRDVVTRGVRALMAAHGVRLRRGAALVEQWVGFTTDELERLSDHRKKFIKCRWPLIEMRMNRPDCERWFELRQLPVPPKSSCVFCPYQGDHQWLGMKNNAADDDWSRAVTFDQAIRPYFAGASGSAFVHRSCQPLAEVNFDKPQGDLFGEDCLGACGT